MRAGRAAARAKAWVCRAATGLAVVSAAPQPAEAANDYVGVTCVRLLAGRTGDVVINTCPVCRQVGVERSRPGTQFPTPRTVVVPAKSRIELGFLGPGRTRLVSEEPCRGGTDEGIGRGPGSAATDGRECVQFGRSGAAFVLLNGCDACRSVVVERTDPAGRRERNRYLLASRSTLPYPAAGAASAEIVAETPCR